MSSTLVGPDLARDAQTYGGRYSLFSQRTRGFVPNKNYMFSMTAFAYNALLLLGALGAGQAQTLSSSASSSGSVAAASSSATTSTEYVYTSASSSEQVSTATSVVSDGGYTSTEIVGVTIYSTVGQTYTATSSGSDASSTDASQTSASSSSTTSLVPESSTGSSSDTGKKIGIGVGVGVGVPLLLACLALGVFLFKRRSQTHASPAVDDEEDPFSANINKYHTTNAAANF